MDAVDPGSLLAEQIAYYRAWAPTYDEAARRDEIQSDRPELERALAAFKPAGGVLELAGGTGNWTVELGRYARYLTVVDTSSEALAINEAKLAAKGIPVDYVCANVFDWEPQRRYEVVFFSYWLTHVPPGRFEEFWRLVGHCLAPEGRVFFIDNARPSRDAAVRDELVVIPDDPERGVSFRRLGDGRQYRVVKVFWHPEALQQRLRSLGFEVEVLETAPRRCIYGHGARCPHPRAT